MLFGGHDLHVNPSGDLVVLEDLLHHPLDLGELPIAGSRRGQLLAELIEALQGAVDVLGPGKAKLVISAANKRSNSRPRRSSLSSPTS